MAMEYRKKSSIRRMWKAALPYAGVMGVILSAIFPVWGDYASMMLT